METLDAMISSPKHIENPMLNALNRIHVLDGDSVCALVNIIQCKHFKKGTQLLAIGELAKDFYFFAQGSGRIFYWRNGEDITDYFALNGHFMGGLESLMSRQPSEKGMEVLEDSELYFFSYADFEKLFDDHQPLERLARKMAIYGFLEGQKRVENLRFLSAQERYLELLKTYPDIENRVLLKHIASFLGITQVSLSRIRAGLQ